MTQFPGQLTTHSLNGTIGDVWQFKPFYLKVFFVVKKLSVYIFCVTDA